MKFCTRIFDTKLQNVIENQQITIQEAVYDICRVVNVAQNQN